MSDKKTLHDQNIEKMLAEIKQQLEGMSEDEMKQMASLKLVATKKGVAKNSAHATACWEINTPCFATL